MARHLGSTIRWAAILLLAAAFAFPLYWTATMAFKPTKDWNPPGETIWWPQRPTLDNFTSILGLREPPESSFLQQPTRSATRPIRNSLIAAGGGTALALLAGIPAAYGIARFRAGEGCCRSRSRDLRSSDRGRLHSLGRLLQVALPQVSGGLAATALFVFILSWSDFLIAAVMTGAITAPVFLSFLQGDEFERQFGPLVALSLILMLPPTVLAVALRRHLVPGLTLGAVRR